MNIATTTPTTAAIVTVFWPVVKPLAKRRPCSFSLSTSRALMMRLRPPVLHHASSRYSAAVARTGGSAPGPSGSDLHPHDVVEGLNGLVADRDGELRLHRRFGRRDHVVVHVV